MQIMKYVFFLSKFLFTIWPKENQIIHWDIEDPVIKLNDASEDKKFKIITDTFNNIDKRIKN